jgi:hypothetical protein
MARKTDFKGTVMGNINDLTFTAHFVWMKDDCLACLLGKIRTTHNHNTIYCDNCLNRFSTLEGLNGFLIHRDACIMNKPSRFTLPVGEKKFLKFNKFKAMETHPFVIYADLEAVNSPTEQSIGTTKVLAEHKVRTTGG